jgi:hypothetical protein
VDTLKEVEVVEGRVSIVGMRNASERLYDEFCGYITEKNQAEQRARHLLANDTNADTASIAMLIAELDRKIMECHEQARKLGTSLY